MVEGVSWKWTVLPVLARPRRSVNGTSTPYGQGDRGQQRQGGQPPGVAAVAAQVEVDGVVDGMGGVGNQEPGQRQGEPVAPGHRQHQGDPDAELEGPASWTKWCGGGKPAASANHPGASSAA